ncbi:MAG: metallophosphoesterase [Clostridium sp.]|jgi:predicted phosphodiesterase/ribosome-associated translation inhibitor RaiA|uniref:metallophosphoesterase n=1 Tax=Clostridium sp. TaxID=1506 RepID=UPI0025C1C447|nr:metallophosphoesterase [Clostridium sp.]MCH3965077.1 metallophosphoesterase [Clostridium sp.]MCI1714298.1 metallophosphoesterase [Clostridium sp.]MCI1798560.1 metallophosphoesterase [Clostridium sp.]MCI1812709.1 metallophosphoesterase [Clostridium sp.]MCI1869369.1 metallophosphoesterase [Clostridium sp.]
MLKRNKKMMVLLLTATMLTSTGITAIAASNDGWTEASQTEAAKNGVWDVWVQKWETVKKDPTQMSLTPGRNATELNFGWYSKDGEADPQLKIGTKQDLSDAKEIDVTKGDVPENTYTKGYNYNHATATGLEENTTYYYSYTVNGEWTAPTIYRTKDTESFSFLLVGDPQIGSSSGNTATGESGSQGQDAAVRNDSFNWNNTINTALAQNPDVSFMISAGDQIQTTKEEEDEQSQNIEYAGYLSPEALKSLPVATTIGNHDSKNVNYTYHFNNPNASDKGTTTAGGDYYYSYGNTLFIDLNTNSENYAEHEDIIKEAISKNPDVKWRVVTLHHDIYGPGEHSNEPEIVNKRYNLAPIFEDNKIDIVLTGHDHTYSRSYMLKGGVKDESKMIDDDTFETQFEDNDLEGKETSQEYKDYLKSIEDPKAVQKVDIKDGETGVDQSTLEDANSLDDSKTVVNPTGILYMTADSASGSKYYDLVKNQQAYVAARWQEDIPTYSTVSVDDTSFTINTFRTDTGAKIDNSFTIVKSEDSKATFDELKDLISEGEKKVADGDNYTKASLEKLNTALEAAKAVSEEASEEAIAKAYADLKGAIDGIQTKGDKTELQTAIDTAQDEYDKAAVGTKEGQYPQEAKDKLNAAIETARTALDLDDDSQTALDKATEALNTSVENFKNSVVKGGSGDSSDEEGLQSATNDADALLEDTKDKIGTGDKQYKQEKADALKAAVAKAKAVLGSEDSSPDDVKNAREELDKAVENFKAGDDFKFYPLAALAGLSAAALLFINRKRKLFEK